MSLSFDRDDHPRRAAIYFAFLREAIGRQCEKFARLEKGSLTATPGLSERYPQESPKCPASFAKGPGDKTLYCSAMRTDFCDLLGIEHPWYNQGSFCSNNSSAHRETD